MLAAVDVIKRLFAEFSKHLQLQFIHPLLLLEQPEPRADDFAGAAEAAGVYVTADEAGLMVGKVDVLGGHKAIIARLAKIAK